MGKPTGKKKQTSTPSSTLAAAAGAALSSPRGTKPPKVAAFDEDTAMFITMSQELKEEGNKLLQKRDHEGAMLKYEKALKLLPMTHIDVAYLRTNMASCYMQLGLGEYPRAINECNLALEVSPKYTKALLKRARCYEALNRLDLAFRDVSYVLRIEPNNLTGLELLESVKIGMAEKGLVFDEKLLDSVEEGGASRLRKLVKEKVSKKKKKAGRSEVKEKKVVVEVEEKKANDGDVVKDKEVVVKNVEEEKNVVSLKDVKEQELVTRTVKLVFSDDIRWAQLPVNCNVGLLRSVVLDRFPGLKGVLMKYKDPEGDLVTITTTEELRLAEMSSNSQGSLRFYIVEVGLEQEPAYEGMKVVEEKVHQVDEKVGNAVEDGNVERGVEVENRSTSIDDWLVQFARLFKNHVGFDSDSYLDIHELGMKLYSEALEDAVTSEEAQELFDIAADKFQEMVALALFNWGNVHMSRARKRVFFTEDGFKETVLAQVKTAYEWAKKEYIKAGTRYEEALKIKPDFYDGLLALGQQQFEQAKLCWYHALASKIDFESGPSEEILNLYNKAEDCMERGMQMWEESEECRLNGLSKFDKYKEQLQKMGLEGYLKDQSAEEAAEQAANMSAQIYLLWGTMLYERSVVEYKLELPTWEECLEVSVEKFELAGASPTDVAVMIKNHCSNETSLEGEGQILHKKSPCKLFAKCHLTENFSRLNMINFSFFDCAGLGFKIDEIVQAWNEMYDAKRWEVGLPSFRLEPLFRRRAPKLHSMLEQV